MVLLSELAILVPVLRRPGRVRPLLESIAETVPEGTRVVFICDAEDTAEQKAIHASLHEGQYGLLAVQVLLVDGGYAKKINEAVRATTEPLLLLAADDLEFHDGWFELGVDHLVSGVEVIGINDLIDRPHRPEHATHFLMTRRYAEQTAIDGSPGPLFAGYMAWHCDDELIGTAKRRGVYAYAPDVVIEHLHHINGKADDDETYQLGRVHAKDDRRTFRDRERLWR